VRPHIPHLDRSSPIGGNGRRRKAGLAALALLAVAAPAALMVTASAGAAVTTGTPALQGIISRNQATFIGGTFAGNPGVALVGGPDSEIMAADVNGKVFSTLITSARDFVRDHTGLRVVSGDFTGDHQTDFVMLPTPTASTGGTSIPLMQQTDPSFAPGHFSLNRSTGWNVDFLNWAATAGVTPIPGDFNGDGKTDIALVGGAGWTKIPIAFATDTGPSDPGFNVTNIPAGGFPGWASTAGTKATAGDFDGDGWTDLALTTTSHVGNNTSIPLATSRGDGSFTVTNYSSPAFATWASQPGARVIAGNFDAAHPTRAGLALAGIKGWTTMPVAISDGTGNFNVINGDVGAGFGAWASTPGVQIIPIDHTYDGLTDVVLTGVAGWDSIRMAAATGDGRWNITTGAAPKFTQRAATAHATVVGASVMLMVVGDDGPDTLPVAFSFGNGGYDDLNDTGEVSGFQYFGRYDGNAATPTPTQTATTTTTATPPHSATFELLRQPVGVGSYIPYVAKYPSFGSVPPFHLLGVQFPLFGSVDQQVFLVKPGHNTEQCGDPDAVIQLLEGQSLSPAQITTLYGSTQPHFSTLSPLAAVACWNGNGAFPNFVDLNITIQND
jgi:hypothetical protein